MLPEPLPFGNYELHEQQSPWGYVLDKEPVPFMVDGSQDVVTVEKYNIPQKGTITVSKEGEVFSHVAESGGMYQPQYEVQGQPGAVYEITALEDVITPDGTVHLKAGELAAALTTPATLCGKISASWISGSSRRNSFSKTTLRTGGSFMPSGKKRRMKSLCF